ncbi:hypothetical protein [Paenibacillus sp. NPDC058071]|uniref:hypothetical protein n=1 Tax=Paenibacillus sp. NPDC058071 TaxID=3346326 RepID=UPI0036D7F7D1
MHPDYRPIFDRVRFRKTFLPANGPTAARLSKQHTAKGELGGASRPLEPIFDKGREAGKTLCAVIEERPTIADLEWNTINNPPGWFPIGD